MAPGTVIRLERAEKEKCDNATIMPCGFVKSCAGLTTSKCIVIHPIVIEMCELDEANSAACNDADGLRGLWRNGPSGVGCGLVVKSCRWDGRQVLTL